MKYFLSSERARFWILVAIVSISGFSQGMLLPLIAVIFEQDGVSSALNGLSATGLYIGIIAVAPFMEPQLRKFGFKPLILVGGAMVILALLAFPLWKSVLFWFVLRILIGVGDQALHFSTQTWITSTSPHHKLGRNIAIYGMSFSVGFGAGPLFVPLVEVFEALPFIISGILCLIAWSLVFFLRNDFPEHSASSMGAKGTLQRFRTALVIGWVAFLPPLGYGFLEASLSAIYPVYALRQSFDISMVSYILAAFSVGAIATQLPLGELSDRIGRKKVLMIALSGGDVIFGSDVLRIECLAHACLIRGGRHVCRLDILSWHFLYDRFDAERIAADGKFIVRRGIQRRQFDRPGGRRLVPRSHRAAEFPIADHRDPTDLIHHHRF